MALSLLINKPIEKRIAEIVLDATISEQHELINEVSQNPVESGATNTEHVRNLPRKLTIEGIVTNTPLRLREGQFGGKFGALIRDDESNKARVAFELLENLYNEKEVFEVVTGLKVYSDMMINRITIPRNIGTSNSLRFTIDMQRISFVSGKEVDLPNISETRNANDRAPTVERSKQTTAEAKEEQEEKVSILKGLFNTITR